MPTTTGLRERKKAEARQRIADAAALLFARHGYDEVSVADVARAADVSDQTVYNYFPAKQDLVFDRAEEIRRQYERVVADRSGGVTPADALRPLVLADIERFVASDPTVARGEFPAQCAASPLLRRAALQLRDEQSATVAEAIRRTDPTIPAIVARSHGAALISVVQTITDAIGAAVLAGTETDVATTAAHLRRDASVALDVLSRAFGALAEPGLIV